MAICYIYKIIIYTIQKLFLKIKKYIINKFSFNKFACSNVSVLYDITVVTKYNW